MLRVTLKLIGLILFLSIAFYLNQAENVRGFTSANPSLYRQEVKTPDTALAAGHKIYYENTIKDIIRRDCGRCHSGVSRNLMDYYSLKAYVDNGMLWAMISPGGSMNRFAETDADNIITWINSGALEKPQTVTANFVPQPPAERCIPGFGPKPFPVEVSLDQINYSNTIKYILTKDCMECHSIPFRNLSTYKNVKYYVDNGLLKRLVQLGGSMHRFAGPDSQYIIAWINNGAPK